MVQPRSPIEQGFQQEKHDIRGVLGMNELVQHWNFLEEMCNPSKGNEGTKDSPGIATGTPLC